MLRRTSLAMGGGLNLDMEIIITFDLQLPKIVSNYPLSIMQ